MFSKLSGYLPRARTGVRTLSSLIALSAMGWAATLPENFEDTVVAGNLSEPVAMAFTPDGRLLVSQRRGAVRLIKNGQLISTPFLSLSVNTGSERGLHGIAIDPNFDTNGYVYVFYTPSAIVAPETIHTNRVSRFQVSSTNADVANPASERILVDRIPSTWAIHNGGALVFGVDGKLYITTGDGGSGMHPQSLTSLGGKVLRINSDGTIPSDNPFASSSRPQIWAYGFRNPYTAAVDPANGVIYINDVGGNSTDPLRNWEEVNQLTRGANYGWPNCEGTCTVAGVTSPVFTYNHTVGKSILGGAFYRRDQFPATYDGSYFFGDYIGNFIKRLDSNKQVQDFATDTPSPIDIQVGPDGSLYYLSIGTGTVHRIAYVTENKTPIAVATATPTSSTALTNITFSGSGSSDPDGDTLTYKWDFGDETSGSGVSVVHQYKAGGTYTATLTVTDEKDASAKDTVQIIIANTRPSAAVSLPVAGARYKAGDVITYSGTGTDAEDGTLPASAFSWSIALHHDTHSHPFLGPITGIKQGTFQIPANGETASNVFYRISLTVKDSQGLPFTTFRDVLPVIATLTFNTSPTGLAILLDSQPKTAPYSEQSVTGMNRTLGVVSPQTLGSNRYKFVSWSDGGAQNHVLVTPATATTITANFELLPAISAVSAGSTTSSGSTIRWTTNKPASGQVEYGTTTGYGRSSGVVSSLTTGHSINLTGLLPQTVYNYRVRSVDSSGNVALSGNYQFTTAAAGAVPAAPTSLRLRVVGSLVALIWVDGSTNETGFSIERSTDGTNFSQISTVGANVQNYSMYGLTPGVTYYFRVRAFNANGNSGYSGMVSGRL